YFPSIAASSRVSTAGSMLASTRNFRPLTRTISTVIFSAPAAGGAVFAVETLGGEEFCDTTLAGGVFGVAEFCAVRVRAGLDRGLLLGAALCWTSLGTVPVCSVGLLLSVGAFGVAATTGSAGLLGSLVSVGVEATTGSAGLLGSLVSAGVAATTGSTALLGS